MKAIKVFEESEKRIRMDPDIAKLIRNTAKESKYVHLSLRSMKSLVSSLQRSRRKRPKRP